MLKKNYRLLAALLLLLVTQTVDAQQSGLGKDKLVNVFLGSSGDHGQMSPAASYPFSALSIAPQTYPATHTGYEHLAKEVFGFTHNRFEGVGCQGSGGIILVKPFLGAENDNLPLMKAAEHAGPGFYDIAFTNGIKAGFVVNKQTAIHEYTMPAGKKGFSIDLGHTFNNALVDESHTIDGNVIKGWVAAKTTCHAGTYRIYYQLSFNQAIKWKDLGEHQLVAVPADDASAIQVRVDISSVSTEYAVKASKKKMTFEEAKKNSAMAWDELLSSVDVKGNQQQ